MNGQALVNKLFSKEAMDQFMVQTFVEYEKLYTKGKREHQSSKRSPLDGTDLKNI